MCWSPDGRYIASGGEDDLVSIYGMAERGVVAWGEGHSSWVTQVAFDPWYQSMSWNPSGFTYGKPNTSAVGFGKHLNLKHHHRIIPALANLPLFRLIVVPVTMNHLHVGSMQHPHPFSTVAPTLPPHRHIQI